MLNMIEYAGPSGDGADAPVLLIVHGLYGSARNWGAVAKRLAKNRRVVSVDMRNHGASPWYNTHSYQDMADDLSEIITDLGGNVDVMGHSMGGKAAMVCALQSPALVNRLIVVDIAPVAYTHSQLSYISAMQAVDLATVQKRSDVSEMLAEYVDDPALISFFAQSVDVAAKRWRLNLEVLADQMPLIMGFPEVSGVFEGRTLLLTGGQSPYVTRNHRSAIKTFFPQARFASIKGAGHWLHAEKPREVIATVDAWLGG
ncbi:MAG: alpha/beta fold hydrolase [Rhodobacterales bacterium]|nr:alpha/beta fold hydrolase [Rhodobacterales bacterium]